MSVIVVVGMPGSGKEEFVAASEAKGYQVVRMGDVVRDEAKKKGLKLDDQDVGGLAASERHEHGPTVWAERTLERVKGDKCIIDGTRSLDEVERFRQAFGQRLLLVAVFAPERTRYDRLSKRGRGDDPKSIDEFRTRDKRELGWGLGSAFASADLVIVNDATVDGFKEKAAKLLERLDNEEKSQAGQA
jgi:dephospho-CoA kinase